MKRNCIILAFACLSFLFAAMGVFTIGYAEEQGYNLTFDRDLNTDYVVGDTVSLPTPLEAVNCFVLVEKIEDDSVIIVKEFSNISSMTYTFDETGEYIISYIYKVGNKNCNTNFNVKVNEFKNGFDFSIFPSKMNLLETVKFENIYYYSNQVKKICDVIVVDPAGNFVDVTNGVFSPNEIGDYTVKAEVKVSGKVLTESFKLEVYASSAMLFETGSVKAVENYALPSWSPSGNGVLLYTSQSYVSTRYNNIIDLRKLNSNVPLIKFQSMCGVDDVLGIDFAEMSTSVFSGNKEWLKVRITDIYDPNRYITFCWRSGEYNYYLDPALKGYSYLMTAPSDFNMDKWGDFAGDGRTDVQYSTFYGADGAKYGGAKLFDVSYDYDLNTAYFDGGAQVFAHYNDASRWGKYAFERFTTGEVYLDIIFGGLAANRTSGLVITDIAGTSLSGKSLNSLNNVGNDTIKDTVAPIIKINTQTEYIKEMPKGCVNKAYPVPTAYSNDAFCGRGTVKVKVSKGNEEYTVENNSFIPNKTGVYTIEYTATDAFANISREVLSVEVVETIAPIGLAFKETITPVVGRYINFGSLVASGGSGKINIEYKIYYNGDEVEVDHYNKLYLDKEGDLKIVFYAEDYIYTEIENPVMEYEVVANDDVYINVNGYVQKFAQQNSTITLPDFTAVSFGQGSNITKKILVNGKEIDGFKYCVKENIGELIEVTYLATNNGVDYKETFAIEVTEEYISVENGFVTKNVETELKKNSMLCTLTANAEISAPNVLVAQDFGVEFDIALANVSFINICFADTVNSNSVTLRLEKSTDNGKLDLHVNGEIYAFSPDLLISNVYSISLVCDLVTGRISTGNDVVICAITEFDDGYSFTGFTNDIMFASMEFVNCLDSTELNLISFANQTFTQFSNIIAIGPQLKAEKEITSQKVEKNTLISIPVIKGYDLFDGECEVFVNVSAPDKSKIISSASCNKELSFMAEKEGTYVVTFISYDKNDGVTTISYRYTVVDKEAPSIDVNTKDLSVKVGQKITVPSAIITDNVSKNVTCHTFVIMKYGKYVPIENNEYVFDEVGVYEIIYIAIDDQYNIARKVIKVTVTE